MISDLAILTAADRIKTEGATIPAKLRSAFRAVRTDTTLPDADSQLKAAVIATLRAAGPGDQPGCELLMDELDVLFGATAARTGQPITLATVLSALPGGRFPIGVLGIWLEGLT